MEYRGVFDEVGKFLNLYCNELLLVTLPFDGRSDQWGRYEHQEQLMAYNLRQIDGEWHMTVYHYDSDTGYIKLNKATSVTIESSHEKEETRV